MKILYLTDVKSVHTQKWAKHFTKKGFDVSVISLTDGHLPGINVFGLGYKNIERENDFKKLLYFTKINKVSRLIKEIKPDILHAHYATSYGALGAFSGFHPLIVSVWGSDVFDFPKKSLLHKKFLEFNLKKADFICSTSQIMARETKKYTNKKIIVTPFGVNCQIFRPMPDLKPRNKIIIGTIKSLEEKYGIDYLIKAFHILLKKYPDLPLELHICGEGSLKENLHNLCSNLGISEKVKFLGYISHNEVPKIFNTFSVATFLSSSESFGVAAVEAQACAVPVVVSNIGGLPEVIKDDITGFLVPSKDEISAANAIEKLILNSDLRKKMGDASRDFVVKNYEWQKNAKIMEGLYNMILAINNSRLITKDKS